METDNGLANPRGRERRGVQDDWLDWRLALVPPVPRPQDEFPGKKRLPGMFNQARRTGQTWDSLTSDKPCPHLFTEVCPTSWPFCSQGSNLLCLALVFPLYPRFLSASKHAIVSKIHCLLLTVSSPLSFPRLGPLSHWYMPSAQHIADTQHVLVKWVHEHEFFKGFM